MSRSLSASAVRSIFSSQTSEVWVMLIEISHPDMTTIRVSSDSVDTVHDSDTYSPYPFQIGPPDDVANTMPTLSLSIDNVDRLLVSTVRGLATSPDVTVKFVLASTPDVIEAGPYVFQMRNVVYDEFRITATLVYQDILHEPFPAGRITPQNFPGLF